MHYLLSWDLFSLDKHSFPTFRLPPLLFRSFYEIMKSVLHGRTASWCDRYLIDLVHPVAGKLKHQFTGLYCSRHGSGGQRAGRNGPTGSPLCVRKTAPALVLISTRRRPTRPPVLTGSCGLGGSGLVSLKCRGWAPLEHLHLPNRDVDHQACWISWILMKKKRQRPAEIITVFALNNREAWFVHNLERFPQDEGLSIFILFALILESIEDFA